jgi:hypothetical protein
VIHAANRELQIVQGDPRPSPPWDEAPEYQVRETIASVVAALADPERTPEQSHQGWYERLIADGWQYGPVKDEAAKTHPDLVPFDQLPEHEKQKDRLFMAIVRALAPERTSPHSVRASLNPVTTFSTASLAGCVTRLERLVRKGCGTPEP